MGAAAGQPEFAARLRFLRQSLQATAQAERRFALAWSLSYVGMAAGTWVTLPFSSDPQGQRTESAFNSATSLAAALLVLIGPVPIIRAQQRLEAQLAHGPADCAVLVTAEQTLVRAAASQSGARGARAHILSFFSSVGLGLILGYGLQRPQSAAINTTLGIILGELMIATTPTGAIHSLAHYRSGDLGSAAPPTLHLGGAPAPLANGYGLAVGGAW
jgi:hypothetical protein